MRRSSDRALATTPTGTKTYAGARLDTIAKSSQLVPSGLIGAVGTGSFVGSLDEVDGDVAGRRRVDDAA
jgi:hypothetical protein